MNLYQVVVTFEVEAEDKMQADTAVWDQIDRHTGIVEMTVAEVFPGHFVS